MKEIYTDLEEVIKNKLPDPTHNAKIIYVDNNGDVVAETIKNMIELTLTFKDEEQLENGNFQIKWKNDTQEITTQSFIFVITKEQDLLDILDINQFKSIKIKTI